MKLASMPLRMLLLWLVGAQVEESSREPELAELVSAAAQVKSRARAVRAVEQRAPPARPRAILARLAF